MEKNTDDSQDEINRKRKTQQSLPYCFNTAAVNKKTEEQLQRGRDRSKRFREKQKNEEAGLLSGGLTDADKEKREERLRYDREKSKRYREKKKNEVATQSSSDFSRDSSSSKMKKDRQKQNSKRYRDKIRKYLEQPKILVAKVYHFFEQEYEELKKINGNLNLTPLSNFRQRTALATGVSEAEVLEILKEEERRNADKRQEPSVERSRARKRSRQPDSSSDEDSWEDTADDNGQSSNVNDSSEKDSWEDTADDNGQQSSINEFKLVVVKEEPPEYYNEEPEIVVCASVKEEPCEIEVRNEEPEIFITAAVKDEPCDIEVKPEHAQTDPISVDVKTEPLSDVVDKQHSQGKSWTAAAASSVRPTEGIDEETKEYKRKRNREYQRAWRQRNKDLKKKVSKDEKDEKRRERHRRNQRAYYYRIKGLAGFTKANNTLSTPYFSDDEEKEEYERKIKQKNKEYSKRYRDKKRTSLQTYQRTGLKENDKNVEELSQKNLDDLQINGKKLDSNEDQENGVQCRASQNLENLVLTQQLRIYEESQKCITPEVILHRNTDIPGDGNCLFHSLIRVLQLQIWTNDLRRQLRDSPYLNSCHNPQEAYKILSSNNEYGDLDCLYLFTRMYNQNICVHYHYFNVISKNEDIRFCHFKANDTLNWIHLDLRELHFTPYFSDEEKKKDDERIQKLKNKEYSKRYRDKKRTSLQTYQRTGLKENDKNVEDMPQKKLDDLQISSLFGDTDIKIKMEEIEIHEEGVR